MSLRRLSPGQGLTRGRGPCACRPIAPDCGQLIGEVRVVVATLPRGVCRRGERERAAAAAVNLDAPDHGSPSVASMFRSTSADAERHTADPGEEHLAALAPCRPEGDRRQPLRGCHATHVSPPRPNPSDRPQNSKQTPPEQHTIAGRPSLRRPTSDPPRSAAIRASAVKVPITTPVTARMVVVVCLGWPRSDQESRSARVSSGLVFPQVAGITPSLELEREPESARKEFQDRVRRLHR